VGLINSSRIQNSPASNLQTVCFHRQKFISVYCNSQNLNYTPLFTVKSNPIVCCTLKRATIVTIWSWLGELSHNWFLIWQCHIQYISTVYIAYSRNQFSNYMLQLTFDGILSTATVPLIPPFRFSNPFKSVSLKQKTECWILIFSVWILSR